MTTALERGRDVLAAQPFSVLLGTALTEIGEQRVVLELPLRDDLRQQHGFAHGGVVAYLADNALTYAGALALGDAVVTVEMKINYLRPALGIGLLARASVLSSGKTFAVTRCDVFAIRDGVEVQCAAAQGTIARLPAAKDER
jgi:uncharacterized protein (TIGR00369 family)